MGEKTIKNLFFNPNCIKICFTTVYHKICGQDTHVQKNLRLKKEKMRSRQAGAEAVNVNTK